MLLGKLVRLREYSRDDLEKAREFVNDPEIKKYLTPGIPFPLRKEDEEKWYEELNPLGDGTYVFAIEKIDNKEYIGGCGINKVDWKNSIAEVGIFLGKPYWNKGYGTDALKTLINFIFNEMNINKVKLEVFSFNERAIRSYEKIGFKKEGILREEIFRNGQYYDVIIMGLLRKEWKNA